jgi:hypothetical protein
MSRFDDFFDEAPPENHTRKVMTSVSSELERNRNQSRASKRRAIWGFFGLGFAAAAGLLLWNRRSLRIENEMGLAAFAEVETDDVELLATQEDDFIEFLESLQEEEDWEES